MVKTEEGLQQNQAQAQWLTRSQ